LDIEIDPGNEYAERGLASCEEAIKNEEELSQGEDNSELTELENEEVLGIDSGLELTIGEKNALRSAKDYLNFSAFSYTGLVNQLKFEGFSDEEAKYGADNCGANWNEQAAKSAEQYLNFSSFSRSGLIDQLKFEGFTSEQAEYGVSVVGY
jgi:hypothetical protein